ncbi:MAG: DUF3006 domain-containing protein [Clostridia bacterium]|nr:DUF3006 domain-containing protein [Clostridia bacterium]
MRQYSVDRIVDNRVVLVDEKGATVEISACDLPSVQEGDLLTFDGEHYNLNKEQTKQKREEVKNLINSLFQ